MNRVLRYKNLSKFNEFLGVKKSICNNLRGIKSKVLRDLTNQPKPKPFPYKTKHYDALASLFDKTSHRMDENSKLVIIEGPIAAGKSKLAKDIADEFDMLHLPQADLDLMYINSYGYDMRKLDPKLPKLCRSYDEKNFCIDPNHILAAQFQIRMYMVRYWQYIDALEHILSTGQGVVLDRSPFSDFVFLEAMHKNGYISKLARSAYYDIKTNTIGELIRPHLIIYLDVPVPKVKENIKARQYEYEVKSEVFTKEYLSEIEVQYKQKYLKAMESHCELLIYDWSDGGDNEIVIEDIERIDFDKHEVDRYNKKMNDWRFPTEGDLNAKRISYTSDKSSLWCYFNVPRFDVPELVRSAEDSRILHEVWQNAPGMKYHKGYNEDMGDTGILTKLSSNLYF